MFTGKQLKRLLEYQLRKHNGEEVRQVVNKVINAKVTVDSATNTEKKLFDEELKEASKRVKPKKR